MDEFEELAAREREAHRIVRRQWFWLHVAVFGMTQVFLFVVWKLSGQAYPWFVFPFLSWGILIVAHAAYAYIVKTPEEIMIERERRRSK